MYGLGGSDRSGQDQRDLWCLSASGAWYDLLRLRIQWKIAASSVLDILVLKFLISFVKYWMILRCLIYFSCKILMHYQHSPLNSLWPGYLFSSSSLFLNCSGHQTFVARSLLCWQKFFCQAGGCSSATLCLAVHSLVFFAVGLVFQKHTCPDI